MQVMADVKCYYCGHVSGQIIGQKNEALTIRSFVPRPGYEGSAPSPGARLRCERCRGPVFLEDVTPMTIGKVKAIEPAPPKKAPRRAEAA
jgi:DNA-directed RNA polymerase subunit RPC12/RpoP